MTTPIAVVAITWGGVDVQVPEGICIHSIGKGAPGEPAIVRGGDQVAPSRDGRFGRNRRKDHREIELFGWVCGGEGTEAEQREAFWNNRVTLESLFAGNVRRELAITLPGGAMYTIQALTVPPVLYTPVVPAYSDINIALESIDPDWVGAGS